MIQTTQPEYDCSLVIRTDFTDDAAWEYVCQLLSEPQTALQFRASVECVNNEIAFGITPGNIRSILPRESQRSFVFLVDSEAISRPDHPVLVVDLIDETGRTFRVVPSEAWA